MFNKTELLRLANIFDNAGQVFLGVMVISPLITGVDKGRTNLIVFVGLMVTLICWLISLKITKEAK